ncbi:MAG: hypothetical protein PHG65_08200, partial [Kiritimatiellae bacterium]|nr:hypothetical protein [Kiritimatiellia bacterium]
MQTRQTSGGEHQWAFSRLGGVDQVVFRDGNDLAQIGQLDQALWLALAMPVKGTELDEATAAFLDTNKDGRILPEDVIAAVEWSKGAFLDLNDLMKGGDAVRLDAIREPELQSAAKRILTDLGRKEADHITLEDVFGLEHIFASARFNGDGVITPESVESESGKAVMLEIMSTVGSTPDRSGKPGINQALLDLFFAQAALYVGWLGEVVDYPAPLDAEKTMAALNAVRAVRHKVNDYFLRCRLAAFDPDAPRGPEPEEVRRVLDASPNLTPASPEMDALPLARIAPDQPLPLTPDTLNPAWADRIELLLSQALHPLLGTEKKTLMEADWRVVLAKLKPFENREDAKPVTAVETLGPARLNEVLGSSVKEELSILIQRDLEMEKEYAQVVNLEKMIRFQRDLYRLLCNYVNFSEFYDREKHALFQAGR